MKTEPTPSFDSEHECWRRGLRAIGTDEVGRGCLAGPVVAAAVVLPDELLDPELSRSARKTSKFEFLSEVDDSKKLTREKREALSVFIRERALVQIAWAFPDEIDRYNILHASMLAMRRALRPFAAHARALLVDGNMSPYSRLFLSVLPEPVPFERTETLVGGDSRSVSIAAASIVAKVYRDRWMTELDGVFPGYAFASHKGYSTPVHRAAIAKLGMCAIHRRSFQTRA